MQLKKGLGNSVGNIMCVSVQVNRLKRPEIKKQSLTLFTNLSKKKKKETVQEYHLA